MFRVCRKTRSDTYNMLDTRSAPENSGRFASVPDPNQPDAVSDVPKEEPIALPDGFTHQKIGAVLQGEVTSHI